MNRGNLASIQTVINCSSHHQYAAREFFVKHLQVFCCFPQLKTQKSLSCRYFSQQSFPFPWRQHAVDHVKEDPFHHKFCGITLLRRVFRNYSREDFNLVDFLEGVKVAVNVLTRSINSQDKDSHMATMLGSGLHNEFRRAFDDMRNLKQKVTLDIESSRDFKFNGVRAVCGTADPGDEYCIKFLGQKIITSKHDVFELEKRADSAGYSALFDYGRKLGYSAAEKQLKFQIDVRFSTNERFYIEQKQDEGDWDIVFGSYDIVSTKHNLRFESALEDTDASPDDFPFSWRISNIDFDETNEE